MHMVKTHFMLPLENLWISDRDRNGYQHVVLAKSMSILEFVCLRVIFHTVHNRANTTCCRIPIDTICLYLYSLLYHGSVSRENLKGKLHILPHQFRNPDSGGTRISQPGGGGTLSLGWKTCYLARLLSKTAWK